ncbi:MAG: hypothetical protein ACRYFR_06815 [Janthinobacterium lividum]
MLRAMQGVARSESSGGTSMQATNTLGKDKNKFSQPNRFLDYVASSLNLKILSLKTQGYLLNHTF